MHVVPSHQAELIRYLVTAAVIGVVLLLRLRGLRRARRLRLETLWIVPALFLAAFAAATWEYPPPTPAGWLWLAAAAAAGAALGWQRGRTIRIAVDPATHALNQQASPAALLVIVALIAARAGLRYEAASLGINILKVTGLLLAFSAGLMTATRAEMALRARRLLAAARVEAGRGRPA